MNSFANFETASIARFLMLIILFSLFESLSQTYSWNWSGFNELPSSELHLKLNILVTSWWCHFFNISFGFRDKRKAKDPRSKSHCYYNLGSSAFLLFLKPKEILKKWRHNDVTNIFSFKCIAIPYKDLQTTPCKDLSLRIMVASNSQHLISLLKKLLKIFSSQPCDM